MGTKRDPVRNWMSRSVACVDQAVPVCEAWAKMQEREVYHLVVTQDGRPRGVVCGCELIRASASAPVWRVMSSPPITVLATANVEAAATLLEEAHVGCLPVVWRRKMIGIVTRSDLRRAGALPPSSCSACGGGQHLRANQCGVILCVACRDRALSHGGDEELGEGD